MKIIKEKKILIILLISLFSIALVSLGTYAVWLSASDLLTDSNTIQSGQVKMSYTETNEIGMSNVLPIKDETGKKSDVYFDFTVSSWIKTNKNNSTKQKLNYNIVLEPLKVDNPLNDNEIKVYLTMVENGKEFEVLKPTTIDKLNQYVLKSQEEIFSNGKDEVTTSYRLRAWIDWNVDTTSFNEKQYSYKFRINVNNNEAPDAPPNAPELANNMIPVYYDSTNSVWRKADSANINNNWYNYSDKKWANAVTVSETNRGTYLRSDVGTEIKMEDINTMWVWIPRYTYTYLNTNTPEEIKIKFEDGTSSNGTITCTNNVSGSGTTSQTCTDSVYEKLVAGKSTYTHPAFTFGDEELTGIWVGKFENSAISVPTNTTTEESTIIIKPGVEALRYKAISDQFKDIRQLEKANNIYGFTQNSNTTFNWNGTLTGDSNNIDTHMMKNTEWGAVAYLSHSKYGRCANDTCEEITINNCTNFVTGIGGDSINAPGSTTTCTTNKNKYDGTSGVKASTTGNIYGVYDMSGGSYEYVMGNEVNSSNQFSTASTGEWNSTTYPLSKYYDSYTYDGASSTTYTRGRIGDATVEMAPTSNVGSWYKNYAIFVSSSNSWFLRGGGYFNGNNAGAFSFICVNGLSLNNSSSRSILVITQN